MDRLQEIFTSFLAAQPHTHAPEEVLAALDILRDEENELEPEDKEFMAEAKKKIKDCAVCANSLHEFSVRYTPHMQPVLL